MSQSILTFEHPLNERIRIFLRLEHLFKLVNYRFAHSIHTWDTQHCIATIIELYNLIERTEFRSELLKEIERHGNSLQRLAKTPTIDHAALQNVLSDIERASETLQSFSVKQELAPKDSELFNSIRQRITVPGGICSFDLPVFHYWLHLPHKTQQAFFYEWTQALHPLEKVLSFVLELTRQSNLPIKEMASAGVFQKTLNTQSTCQLIRISLSSDSGVYPEISASKHRVNIRFLLPQLEKGKPEHAIKDIPFELTCCTI